MTDISRLPKPVADKWDWQKEGLCRGKDSDAFFHPDGERGSARAKRITKAKAICRDCPVLTQCREHALTVEEPFGVWGGMSETELKALIKKNKRHTHINA